MVVTAQVYYLVNDLFRATGKRITMRDLDPIGNKLGIKYYLRLDKMGTPGFMSRALLKNLGVDGMLIMIEGETEEAVKNGIRELYRLYGPYETAFEREYALARSMKKELP